MAVTFFPISFTAAASYKDVGAFVHKLLRRGKSDAAIAPSYRAIFPLSLPACFALGFICAAFIAYCASIPPSTTREVPVVNFASSEQR
jgi:hypothetical protein